MGSLGPARGASRHRWAGQRTAGQARAHTRFYVHVIDNMYETLSVWAEGWVAGHSPPGRRSCFLRSLLDENFPLQLHRSLRRAGIDAEHIIDLDQLGISDAQILDRLKQEQELVVVTQDEELSQFAAVCPGRIVIS